MERNKKPIKVLVIGMTQNPGGMENFIINYYRHINKEIVDFDFLCHFEEPIAFEDEIIESGGRCYHIRARSESHNGFREDLEQLFQRHAEEWDAVWLNVCSLANIEYLKIAKKYHVSRRIIHSHNSQNMDSKLRCVLHYINKKTVTKYATDYWACSEDAAKWFYEGEYLKKSVVIHNAIDVERLRFNEEKREEIRRTHNWNNQYVIGNIGRLHFQKNQSFILDVFQQYHMRDQESILVLVGQGEDEQKLKAKAKSLHIEDAVYFAGVQTDIQGWLSSFDLFLFPSKFEGLGIAALEAEANGLPVIASSDVIPQEVKMNDNFTFLDLKESTEVWSREIEREKDMQRAEYDVVKQSFISNDYEIECETKRLENLFERE